MQKSNKRMIAIILTAVLLLSLMLTACGKSGNNPTGDNSNTPGTSSTPGTTPGDGIPTDSPYAVAKKAVDDFIANLAKEGIDVNAIIEEAYAKYPDLIDKDVLTPEFLRILWYVCGGNDLRLDGTALEDTERYLKEKGYEPLGSFGEPRVRAIYGIIQLSRFATEKGYGTEQYGNLIRGYYQTMGYNSENGAKIFENSYYPALSKDAPTPTTTQPLDPNREPHPDSPYAKAKAVTDDRISTLNNSCSIDIDNVIEKAYEKYGSLIDKNIVNPIVVKTIISATVRNYNNLTGMDSSTVSRVNDLLKENGFNERLDAQFNATQSIEAMMIHMTMIARQNNLGAEKLEDIVYNHYLQNFNGNATMANSAKEMFCGTYLPWLSIDWVKPEDDPLSW